MISLVFANLWNSLVVDFVKINPNNIYINIVRVDFRFFHMSKANF